MTSTTPSQGRMRPIPTILKTLGELKATRELKVSYDSHHLGQHIKPLFEVLFGITKLSDAVQALITGLEENEQHRYFELNMATFGEVRAGVCFGCAATAALSYLARPFSSFDLWNTGWLDRLAFSEDKRETDLVLRNCLQAVEHWYDHVRVGWVVDRHTWRPMLGDRTLEDGHQLTGAVQADDGSQRPYLSTIGWREDLIAYKAWVVWLKEEGL